MDEPLIGFENEVNKEKITSQNVRSWTARLFSLSLLNDRKAKKNLCFCFLLRSLWHYN